MNDVVRCRRVVFWKTGPLIITAAPYSRSVSVADLTQPQRSRKRLEFLAKRSDGHDTIAAGVARSQTDTQALDLALVGDLLHGSLRNLPPVGDAELTGRAHEFAERPWHFVPERPLPYNGLIGLQLAGTTLSSPSTSRTWKKYWLPAADWPSTSTGITRIPGLMSASAREQRKTSLQPCKG